MYVLKKSVHGPGPWQGVHGPGPWKWSMDPVQSGGPWTRGPCFVLTRYKSIESIIEKLIDKSIKWILLDKNRLVSLKNRSKSVITKYWRMCIDFLDFNNVIIHGRPKDTREILRYQEESITQSAIERSVDKLKKRVFQGITIVACSLFYLATACYCKLLCLFFSVVGLFTGNQRWSTARVSAGTLILVLPEFWLLLLSDCV